MEQKIWTDKEVEELKRLAGTGTANQIAIQLGRSKDSVRHKLKWLKAQETPEDPKEEVKQAKPKAKPVERSLIEYCPSCKAPVRNWDDHIERMGRFGCKRPE